MNEENVSFQLKEVRRDGKLVELGLTVFRGSDVVCYLEGIDVKRLYVFLHKSDVWEYEEELR